MCPLLETSWLIALRVNCKNALLAPRAGAAKKMWELCSDQRVKEQTLQRAVDR